MKTATAILAAVAVLAGPAHAVTVEVTVTGTVAFNGIGDPPLGDAMSGDPASLTFLVDSANFVDGIPGDTRGYEIDQASFVLTVGPAMVGLADPFPPGETPFFTLADGIPVSDRFWVSTSTNSPGGVPLEQEPSLDILDALGIYDFDGLTSFGFNLWAIFPDNVAMEIDFEQMTISAEVGVTAAVDIKPGSCPNSFNRKSRGKLPVAVLGTADFDVADIDVDTVEVSRADGVGGSVAPLRTGSGDVGTPFEGEPCDCHEMGGDGWDDLTLKFRSREVVAALELGTLMGGDFVELTVSGSLLDGTPFSGTDCIRLVPPDKAKAK
ncbi:MAG: hypothetical protein ACYSUA_16850, partial [Planctomycetota bacterium]